MNLTDESALKAKNDSAFEEIFIKDHEAFIMQAAYRTIGQYITKSDDRWLVSLLAFDEAIKSYSSEKGSFFAFAEIVIRRRLYDEYKRQSKYNCEIPINPYSMESDSDEEEEEDISLKRQVVAAVVSKQDDDAKLEIDALSGVLNGYGFSFEDLIAVSPKSTKTKRICGEAIAFILGRSDSYTEMKKAKTLPLKIIEENTKLPRKTLERHRKYIIAGIEILSGDYPVLSDYLRFVKEIREESL